MKKVFRYSNILVLSLSLFISTQTVIAASVLLKDINPSGDSVLSVLMPINGNLFFQANDGVNGSQLWKSDGTRQGTVMVKKINPTGSSSPQMFADVNGILFFVADDGVHGYELWKSNGTSSGTVMVKDITSHGSSYFTLMINVNGTLFFGADDGVHGMVLWKSDGTDAGTEIVNDSITNVRNITNVNGTIFFSGYDTINGEELWKSDGTPEGTVLIKDINPSGNSSPVNLTDVNGILFFAAKDSVNGVQLWKSDGTYDGTVMVKLINETGNANPKHMTNANGILFFAADDGIHGTELWKSDGTSSGTFMIKDIKPGSDSSFVDMFLASMTYYKGEVFFTVNPDSISCDLWKSNGTTAGTVLLKNTAFFPRNIDETLFFITGGLSGNCEIWRSDGTIAGSSKVTDIRLFSAVGILACLDYTLFFIDNDGISGNEIWQCALNDDCENAIKIVPGKTYFGSNISATGYGYSSCGYNPGQDTWFCFQPTVGGFYTVNLGSDYFDTILSIHNGACFAQEIGCNDDLDDTTTNSQITADFTKGKKYYINVAGFNGETGKYHLDIEAGRCTQYVQSDLNRDCKVDLKDFVIMASEWMTCYKIPSADCL